VTLAADRSLCDLSLGIVCPMANEGAESVRFVKAVLEQCLAFKRVMFFAVLDNATEDDSLSLLHELAKTEPRLKVVWAPENDCVAGAYVRGYREALGAGSDWILEIDAGFSHQPEQIPRFFQAMQKGYDCAFGTRFARGGRFMESPLSRYLISYGGTILTNLLMGTRLSDMTSGFELFSRDALEMVLEKGIYSRAHFFQTEIKVSCRRLKIAEVPIHYRHPSPRLGTEALSDAFRQLRRLFVSRCKGQL